MGDLKVTVQSAKNLGAVHDRGDVLGGDGDPVLVLGGDRVVPQVMAGELEGAVVGEADAHGQPVPSPDLPPPVASGAWIPHQSISR